jgi:hypothetical protein
MHRGLCAAGALLVLVWGGRAQPRWRICVTPCVLFGGRHAARGLGAPLLSCCIDGCGDGASDLALRARSGACRRVACRFWPRPSGLVPQYRQVRLASAARAPRLARPPPPSPPHPSLAPMPSLDASDPLWGWPQHAGRQRAQGVVQQLQALEPRRCSSRRAAAGARRAAACWARRTAARAAVSEGVAAGAPNAGIGRCHAKRRRRAARARRDDEWVHGNGPCRGLECRGTKVRCWGCSTAACAARAWRARGRANSPRRPRPSCPVA